MKTLYREKKMPMHASRSKNAKYVELKLSILLFFIAIMPIVVLTMDKAKEAYAKSVRLQNEHILEQAEIKRLRRNENARLNRLAKQSEKYIQKQRMNRLPASFQDLTASQKTHQLPPTLEQISFAELIAEQREMIWQLRRTLKNVREVNDRQMNEMQRQLNELRLANKSAERTQLNLRKMLTVSRKRSSALYGLLRKQTKPVNLNDSHVPKLKFSPMPQIDSKLLESTGKEEERICPHCHVYKTTRLSHFKEHVLQTCKKIPKEKSWQCEICSGNFTYRRLQQHLDMYVRSTRKTDNGHQLLSKADHVALKKKYADQFKSQ